MANYWLDANVFIEAKKGPYDFDIVPGFWAWLDQHAAGGIVSSSRMVYDELVEGNDELARWAQERRESALFNLPDALVQQAFQTIADYVRQRYDDANSGLFLEGADAWIIAHALNEGTAVVTCETLVADNCARVKIPNVCRKFNVRYLNTYAMLRELGASFK